MLTIPPPKFRKHRGRPLQRKRAPAALTLVAATYDSAGLHIVLQFDRPIDISGIDTGSIIVRDGAVHLKSYTGGGTPSLDDPSTLRMSLQQLNPIPAAPVTFSASAETGIVAVDDGGTWEGVTDLALPYP